MKAKVQVTTKLSAVQRQLKNINKKAIRAGTALVLKAVRAGVPVRTGALKKSLTSKVDSAKGETNAYGIVGPKSRFKMVLANGKVKHPSRYAAPLEKADNGRPFLLPVWNANKDKYLAAVRDRYAEEMLKVVTSG